MPDDREKMRMKGKMMQIEMEMKVEDNATVMILYKKATIRRSPSKYKRSDEGEKRRQANNQIESCNVTSAMARKGRKKETHNNETARLAPVR